jgi:hypothetical protein
MFGLPVDSVLILLLYAYLMCRVLKKGDMKKKGGLTILVILYFTCGRRIYDTFDNEAVDPVKDIKEELKGDVQKVEAGIKKYLDSSSIGNNQVIKGTMDTIGGGEMGAPIQADSLNMSGYDGLCLKTGNQEYWMKSPDNESLLSNKTLYTYLGAEGPPKMLVSNQAALRGPPVDGVKGSPEKMFMFANNKASPMCCPSTFSTSTGCICSTENQRDFVAARGTLNNAADHSENYL